MPRKPTVVDLTASKPTSELDGPPPKKLRRLTKPPTFCFPSSQGTANAKQDVIGNATVSACNSQDSSANDYGLWTDIYEPKTEDGLAVHKRKVEDVRRWFLEALEGGPSGKLRKYRRVLALTGPAGSGKTATVRVLARVLGFEVLEWKNGVDDRFAFSGQDYEGEALMQKFHAFIQRASSCSSIFQFPTSGPTSDATPPSSSSKEVLPALGDAKPRVILLEDLPNILHPPTQVAFHSELQSLIEAKVPVVVIVSDTGLRGEDLDSVSRRNEVIDVRTVLGSLNGSPYVTRISFNPIAPTLLRRALETLVNAHFNKKVSSYRSKPATLAPPSKDLLDAIVASSNGDIRGAVMGLQFACIVDSAQSHSKKKQRINKRDGAGKIIAVTNREHSLQLFHLMGKVLFNKRKGDPPNPSSSKKDIQRESELDMHLQDPPPLPSWLSDHERRTSRVDVDMLYADTPVDASLLGLYIHQNYTQFCDDIEHCDGVSDWLSHADWSYGEQLWYQANPHRFHLLTLGTMHALPSPVARRSQRFFKPEWFDMHRREKETWDAVEGVKDWLCESASSEHDRISSSRSALTGTDWSRAEIAIELGAVLSARDRAASSSGSMQPFPSLSLPPPRSHTTFSRLVFRRDGGTKIGPELVEDDMGVDPENGDDEILTKTKERETSGGWLDDDDIEEW